MKSLLVLLFLGLGLTAHAAPADYAKIATGLVTNGMACIQTVMPDGTQVTIPQPASPQPISVQCEHLANEAVVYCGIEYFNECHFRERLVSITMSNEEIDDRARSSTCAPIQGKWERIGVPLMGCESEPPHKNP